MLPIGFFYKQSLDSSFYWFIGPTKPTIDSSKLIILIRIWISPQKKIEFNFTLPILDDSINLFGGKEGISRSGEITGKYHMTQYIGQATLYVNPRGILLSRTPEGNFWNTNGHKMTTQRRDISRSYAEAYQWVYFIVLIMIGPYPNCILSYPIWFLDL